MRLVTPEQMREMDRRTIEAIGLPGIVLMERAALGAVHILLDALEKSSCPVKPDSPRRGRRSVGILCGAGNNGGDGLAMARILAQHAYKPVVVLFSAPDGFGPDAALNLKIAHNTGIEIVDLSAVAPEKIGPRLEQIRDEQILKGDLVAWCDALLGTGIDRNLEGQYAEAVAFLNDERRRESPRIVAVDIPTGLNATSGQPMGDAVRAHITATFGYAKMGQMTYPGREICGALEVIDIGIPAALAADVGFAAIALNSAWAKHRLAPRPKDTHKGLSGKLLLLAGSDEKTGAALLAAQGALRSGAGLLTIGTHEKVIPRIAQAIPDAMATRMLAHVPDGGLEERLRERAEMLDAIGIGPGIGTSDGTLQQLNALLDSQATAVVVDADALTVLAKSDTYDRLRAFSLPEADAQPRVVLTPHPAEMARLSRCTTRDILESPVQKAQELARETGAIVVLKTASTIVAGPNGALAINQSGTPGMATGGTGDVLTGIITARLGETHATDASTDIFEVVCLAVYAHGLAGARAAAQLGERGMGASDLAEQLPRVWNDLE